MIKKYIKKRGLSITELADKTNLDHREIERILSGERIPGYLIFSLLCSVLEIPNSEILEYVKNPPKKRRK